jgi:DNA-damage-inducible protein J
MKCCGNREVMIVANTKSNVNVKIDSDVQELATRILERMGLDQTTAIDMFYRQIIAEHRLPFQPTAVSPLDERIVAAALKNKPKRIELGTDANGNVIVDKEQYPDIL